MDSAVYFAVWTIFVNNSGAKNYNRQHAQAEREGDDKISQKHKSFSQRETGQYHYDLSFIKPSSGAAFSWENRMTWKPIVGRLFAPAAFETYVGSLKFGLWRPKFIVVHNTSAPDLKTWAGWQARNPPITDEKWAQNLVGYYRDQQKWSGGPHLFVTPAGILAFTPLTGPGTHSPAWNSISWGVETVGEFEHEPFDGPVKSNLIAALAILHASAGLSPAPYVQGLRGLHFHKEDPKTTHKSCPGKNMVKADLVAAVHAEILRRHPGGGHPGVQT